MGSTVSKVKIAGSFIFIGIFMLLLQDEPSGKMVSGISNMGNTCFLNAILQALSSCDTFTQFLFKLKPVKISSDDFDALIVHELSSFLQSLLQCHGKSPEDLIDALSKKFPYFGEQHDSHEIFYVIQEAISEIRRRTEISFSMEAPLTNPLLGLMSTEIMCAKCSSKTLRLESVFDVSLIVSGSLYESFEVFGKQQRLEDFLCLKCSTNASLEVIKVNKTPIIKEIAKKYSLKKQIVEENDLIRKIKTLAFIQNRIIKFPVLLCIHCKWLVSQASGHLHKQNNLMQFPECFEVTKGKYELKALIEHIGGGYGGHYLTYKLFEGNWYQCSDLDVRAVNLTRVLNAQPYMLFYQLIS